MEGYRGLTICQSEGSLCDSCNFRDVDGDLIILSPPMDVYNFEPRRLTRSTEDPGQESSERMLWQRQVMVMGLGL
jgi:hypothetical protein